MTIQESKQTLSGWAQYPRHQMPVVRPERFRLLHELTSGGTLIARGCGRSYGDAALTDHGQVVDMRRLDRILGFDPEQGLLHAEAGLTLKALIENLLPQGWFPSVTPGTWHVTLGGCIASDVHGKNHHHNGSFSQYVEGLSLIDAQGRSQWISPMDSPDTFYATTGGMGLTGIIGEVKMQLRRVETAYLETQHHAARDLKELMELLQNPEYDDDYTVAWIDCLRNGRGILMRGHHAPLELLPTAKRAQALKLPTKNVRRIPFWLPHGVLNRMTVGGFNSLYFRTNQRGPQPGLSDYRQFFYPLDGLGEWYKLYGHKGFIQYQCVLPQDSAHRGLERLLKEIRSANLSPFLAVLKRMGPEGPAPLSFPMAGYTLAMDLPVSGEDAKRLCVKLDRITLDHKGRVYLAKDACLEKAPFRQMYPRYHEWLKIKHRTDPENRFCSSLSKRLGIPDE